VRSLIFLVIAAALSACASATAQNGPAQASQCRAEMALYRIRGADATLRIMPTPHALNAYSNLAARVDFEGETYWFAFVSSLGYSRNYVGRTVDPFEAAAREDAGLEVDPAYVQPEYDGSELTLFDANFDVIENVPNNGDPAPAHLLATGISSSIWYSVPRRELPKALWDFVECVDDLG
jgi:hypothetical protein